MVPVNKVQMEDQKALDKCPNFFPALCLHSESCKCLSKKNLPLNSVEYEHLALYY